MGAWSERHALSVAEVGITALRACHLPTRYPELRSGDGIRTRDLLLEREVS
jgi:hypothetical protein